MDKHIPAYMISGRSGHEDVARFIQGGGDGYIVKTSNNDEIVNLINNKVLVQRIDFGKPVLMLRKGGSADDVDIETYSLGLGELVRWAEHIQSLGSFQVIISDGAGAKGDIEKRRKRKWGNPKTSYFRPAVLAHYAERYATAESLWKGFNRTGKV